jgi:tetratricopeptide (TPR) repeat protein
MGNIILTKLGDYPYEALSGEVGAEFVSIVDDIAKHRLAFGRYAEAERSYQIALTLWLQNERYEPDVVRHRSTALYHQLGRTVQEQGRRKEAEEYFSKAFDIAKEYNDEHAMGVALRNLFRVWKAGGKQDVPNLS